MELWRDMQGKPGEQFNVNTFIRGHRCGLKHLPVNLPAIIERRTVVWLGDCKNAVNY